MKISQAFLMLTLLHLLLYGCSQQSQTTLEINKSTVSDTNKKEIIRSLISQQLVEENINKVPKIDLNKPKEEIYQWFRSYEDWIEKVLRLGPESVVNKFTTSQ